MVYAHEIQNEISILRGENNVLIKSMWVFLTGLEVGKLYQVRVRAGTVAGYPNLEDHVWRWVAVNLSDRSGCECCNILTL